MIHLRGRQRAILECLSLNAGLTTARVSKAILKELSMFGVNMHQHSGATRSWLNELHKAGMVRHLDNEKPVCWCLTEDGAAALLRGPQDTAHD